jgi:hypothetical protein
LQGARLAGLQGAVLKAKVYSLHMGDFEKCQGGYYFTLISNKKPYFSQPKMFSAESIVFFCFFL